MSRLKAGVIGLGVGEQHIAAYEKHPACETVAICDFDQEKLNEVSNKYPKIYATDNAGEILRNPNIDLVSIASYDNYHFEQIILGLESNKHIFVEKPLCLYSWQAKRIRYLLNKKPLLKLSSNLILRMSPRFIELKSMLQSGDYGNVFYIEGGYEYGRIEKISKGWRGNLDFYSVIYGGAVHIIDLLLWLTGDIVKEVFAYGNNIATKNSNFKHNDLSASIIKFKSGVVAKVSSNFGCVRPHFHSLTLYGTKATFINQVDIGLFYSSRDPNDEPLHLCSEYPGVHKGDLIYSFIDAVINNTRPIVTIDDVFKTMSVCFAMEESMQTRKPVNVKYY